MRDPGQYANVIAFRGCQFSDSFTITDDDGNAVEIASATANIYTGTPDNPGTLVEEVSTDNGMLVAQDNVITRTVAAVITDNIDAGDYWYELLVWLADADDPLEPILGFWQHYPTGLVDSE